jgi:hypothetical protein
MSMKNSNDTIGNGTRDLRACRAVPQPTNYAFLNVDISDINALTELYIWYLYLPIKGHAAKYSF